MRTIPVGHPAGKENKTKGFEAIKAVVLEPEQFSVENDCLTPTFKFKRPQLQKRYQVRAAHATLLLPGGAAAACPWVLCTTGRLTLSCCCH